MTRTGSPTATVNTPGSASQMVAAASSCAMICLGWFLWEVSPEQYKRWPVGFTKTLRKSYGTTEQDTVYINCGVYKHW